MHAIKLLSLSGQERLPSRELSTSTSTAPPGQDVFDGTGDAFETIPSHTLKEDGFPEGSVTDHADCVKQAVDYGLIEMGKNGRKTKGKSVL